MTFIEQIEEVLQMKRSGLHVHDIAERMVEIYPHIKYDIDSLSKKISASLSAQVKKKGSAFARVSGKKKGTYRKGMYRLKARRNNTNAVTFPEQPKVSSQFTGCAGEHAVLSELLFWGFNASMMTVDDGIDIVASKGGDYFHIQVKTSNISSSGEMYGFSVDRKRHQQKYSSSTFYVLVLRRRINNRRYTNDYIIIPSFEIQSMIAKGIISDSQTISMRVSVEKDRFILNGSDVTHIVNNFGIITGVIT